MIYAKAKSTALLAVGLVTLVGCHRTPPQLPLQPLMIAGKAMQPALKEGDRILVTEDLKELKRGDVVVYHYPADQNQSFISRIIGLPNEEVEVNEGRVFVNGRP